MDTTQLQTLNGLPDQGKALTVLPDRTLSKGVPQTEVSQEEMRNAIRTILLGVGEDPVRVS